MQASTVREWGHTQRVWHIPMCPAITYAESLSSRRDPMDISFTPPCGEVAGTQPYWLLLICCSDADIMTGTLGPQMSRSAKPT